MDQGKVFKGGKIPGWTKGKTLQEQLISKIVTDHSVLRKKSEPCSIEDIKTMKLDVVLEAMIKRGWTDGAAISAIQIGVPVQFSYYYFKIKFLKEDIKKGDRGLPLGEDGKERPINHDTDIYIKEFGPTFLLNPYIVAGSAKDLVQLAREGCLSLPEKWFATWRFNEVTVYNAWDQTEIKATGFMAHLLQHEIDHMNGILCSDRRDLDRNGPCPCGKPIKTKKCCGVGR